MIEIMYFDSEIEYKNKMLELIEQELVCDIILRGDGTTYGNKWYWRYERQYDIKIDRTKWFILLHRYVTRNPDQEPKKEKKVVSEHELQYRKEYYQRNKERIREYNRQYKLEHPDSKKIYNKRAKNKLK